MNGTETFSYFMGVLAGFLVAQILHATWVQLIIGCALMLGIIVLWNLWRRHITKSREDGSEAA